MVSLLMSLRADMPMVKSVSSAPARQPLCWVNLARYAVPGGNPTEQVQRFLAGQWEVIVPRLVYSGIV